MYHYKMLWKHLKSDLWSDASCKNCSVFQDGKSLFAVLRFVLPVFYMNLGFNMQ